MNRNRGRVCVALMAVALLGLVANAGFMSVGTASGSTAPLAASDAPPRTGIWPVNFTFYGDAGRGWGLTNATIREPGPTITVHTADIVNLTLIGADLLQHTWFVDYNNDSQVNGPEQVSPPFNMPVGYVVVWNFTAGPPGNWTYRCSIHGSSMTGTIRILPEPRPVNLTLYGDAGLGWGFSNTTIREPGPHLVVLWGTNVTLTLIGHDLAMHTWFIDYDNNSQLNGPEQPSPTFNDPPGKIVVWSFVAAQTGNWTYRCGFHLSSMTGLISIVGGPPPTLTQSRGISLISGILLVALGFVLVLAVVYHVRAVRAVRASKRSK